MTVCSIPSLLFLCYCDKNSWCVYLIELLYCPIQVTPLYIATDLLWVSAFPLPTASVLHSSLLFSFSFSFTPQHQHQHQQPATATANGILNCAVLYRTRLLKSECTILLLLLLPNVPRTACQNNIFSCAYTTYCRRHKKFKPAAHSHCHALHSYLTLCATHSGRYTKRPK